MKKNIILVFFVTILLTMVVLIPSYSAPNTNSPLENLDDSVVLINESFENGFPPENWTNIGWLDSLYGEPYHGDHWGYSWTCGDELTTPPLEFGVNTTLTFWYRAESQYHPMNLYVYVNDTLVWENEEITNDNYEMATVNLDSFSGLKTITFTQCIGDFYGILVDLITVTTSHIVYVDDDFNSSTPGWQYDHFDVIQDGIDAVPENGTVYVYNGTYYEHLYINRSLDLVGENKNSCIINGNETGTIITLNKDHVNITGFTFLSSGDSEYPDFDAAINIQANHTTISNSFFWNHTLGIRDYLFPGTTDIIIENNTFQNVSNYAIHLKMVDNCTIKHNSISDSGDGIKLSSYSYDNIIFNNSLQDLTRYHGILLDTSFKNQVTDNIIISCPNGIELSAPGRPTDYNHIGQNQMSNCYAGIVLNYASNNTVFENHMNNNSYGLYSTQYCYNNTIYRNNFVDNLLSVYDEESNQWNMNYPIGGNYFDNYTGLDKYHGVDQNMLGSDGIGDTPYAITGGFNQDLYPLMYAFEYYNMSTVYVDDDYDNTTTGWNVTRFNVIQDGIDAVAEGGTVYVYNGTYYENVTVNKSIDLIGEDRDNTIVDANNQTAGFILNNDSISIQNFTIKNTSQYGVGIWLAEENNHTTISHCFISDCYYGIDMTKSNHSTISNNQLTNNEYGIHSEYYGNHTSVYNSITQNTIHHNFGGIAIISKTQNLSIHQNMIYNNSFGIALGGMNNGTITENNIIDIYPDYGLYTGACTQSLIANNILNVNGSRGIEMYNSQNNIFENNTINGGYIGVNFDDSFNNSFIQNNISNSMNKGLFIHDSDGNSIYHNIFSKNPNQVVDNGNNIYDNGYPSGGNYWDDYTGTDADGDGIGDKPYNISGGSNQDMYPLGYFHPIANFTYSPSNPIMLSRVYFTDTSIDPDGNITSWFWDFGEGDTSTEQHPSNIFVNEGNYTVCLTVTDDDGKNHTFCQIINVSSGLDVNQTLFDRGFPIRHAVDGDWAGAQSFTPTIDTLTRVEIILRKFGTPEFNLTVELRTDHPQGPLIDSRTYTPDQVSSSWEMFEVNFNDTTVQNDTEYFIVIPPAPSDVTTSFGYEWGYAFGNQYDDGSFWFTRDGGGLWRDLPSMYEFAFRTFGYS